MIKANKPLYIRDKIEIHADRHHDSKNDLQ